MFWSLRDDSSMQASGLVQEPPSFAKEMDNKENNEKGNNDKLNNE